MTDCFRGLYMSKFIIEKGEVVTNESYEDYLKRTADYA